MTVKDTIHTRRTIRKFTQEPVSLAILRELVDDARVGPCSANMQPLKYKFDGSGACGRSLPIPALGSCHCARR